VIEVLPAVDQSLHSQSDSVDDPGNDARLAPVTRAGRCGVTILLFAVSSISAQPNTTVIPDSLEYGEVTDGGFALRSFAVSNAGPDTAFISVTSSNAAFTIDSAPDTLETGDVDEVIVRFAPSSSGSLSATITVETSSILDVNPVVTVTGTAVTPPEIATDTDTLDFGTIVASERSTKILIIRNRATATQQVLAVPSISSSGDSDHFDFTLPGSFDLIGGESRHIPVTYAPTSAGNHELTFSVNHNSTAGEFAPGGSAVGMPIILLGQATALPRLSGNNPSSGELTFPETIVGETSLSIEGTISSGSSTTIFEEIWTTSGEFVAVVTDSSLLGSAYPQGSEFRFQVQFTPTMRGSASAELLIRTNDPSETVRAWDLSGTGIGPQMFVSSGLNVSFGEVRLGSSQADSVVLTNLSTSFNTTLQVVVGLSSEAFVADTDSLSIPPGQSRSVQVTFNPSATGASSALLTLRSVNDPDSTSAEVALSGAGVSPTIDIGLAGADYSLNFGSVRRIDSLASRQFELTNSGTDRATIDGLNLDNLTFGSVLLGSSELEPGETTIVEVTFGPQTIGPHEGTLVVTGDLGHPGGTDSLFVYLSGHGTSPRLSLHPTSYTFPNLTIPNSDTLQALIQNFGDEDLTVSWNSSPSPFVIEAGQETLGPDQFAEIPVVFRPAFPGQFSGALVVSSNDPARPTGEMLLAGNGQQTQLTVPAAVAFGNVRVATSSPAFDIEIRNEGDSRVDLTVDPLASDFVVAGGDLSFEGGQTKQIRVVFTPREIGSRTDILRIVDANQDAFEVTLSGIGIEPRIALPRSEQLQTPVRAGELQVLPILVQNTGTDTLTVDGILVEEAAGVDAFDRVSSPSTSLAPGETDTIQIGFRPPRAGDFEALLIVESDDRISPIDTVRISGEGRAPVLQVTSVDNFDFGAIRQQGLAGIGATGRIGMVIKNVGTDTLYVASIQVADTVQFSIDQLSVEIPPGGEEFLSARFHPVARDEQRTSLTLNLERPNESVRWEDELIGVGVFPRLDVNLSVVDFDQAQVNLGSDTRELTITNTGTDVLRISSLVLTNSENFSILSPSSDSLLVDLAPRNESGDALVLVLQFAPKHTDISSVSETTLPYATTLLIVSDDTDQRTEFVDLTGDGSVSSVEPGVTSIAFGRVQVGKVIERPLSIENEGEQAVLRASFGDPQFSILGDSVFAVPSGGQQVRLTFAPLNRNANLPFSDILTLVDTTTGRTFGVTLSGEGVQGALAQVEPALAFDSVRVAVPVSSNLTLRNAGNDTMTVSVQVAGQGSGRFAARFDTVFLDTSAPFTLPITFTPSVPGRVAVELTILPVDSDIATTNRVALSGVGTAPEMAAQDISFAEIAFGQTGGKILEVQNHGTDDMTVLSINVEEAYRDLFAFSQTSQFAVPRRQTIPVEIQLSATDTLLLDTEAVELTIVHESSEDPARTDTTTVELSLNVTDRLAPEIAFTSDLQTLVPEVSQVALPHRFDVYVRDDSRQIDVTQTEIGWRLGGGDIYTTRPLSNITDVGSGRLRGTASIEIPAGEGSRGVEYFVRTVDRSGNSVTLSASGRQVDIEADDVRPFSLRTRISGLEGVQVEEQPATYHMVSVPMQLDVPDVFEMVRRAVGEAEPISKGDKKRFRVFELAASAFQELVPGRSEGRLTPGNAFWLTLKDRPISMGAGTGWSTQTIPAFDTTLASSGWHLIGHPYSFPVSWSDVEADGVALTSGRGGGVRFWEYGSEFGTGAGTWGIHPEGLRPWRGYAVHVTKETNLRIHPRVLRAAGKQVPVVASRENWRVALTVTVGGATDAANAFGMSAVASDGWDDEDDVEPPPVGQYVRAFFVASPGSSSLVAQMSSDIRPTADGAVWLLRTESNIESGMATLELPIERVPTDISLELFDLESGIRQNMREQSTYRFFNSREHRFMILAGSTSYVDEVIGGLTPSISSLGLAFPNPFNAEVLINYRLSGKGSVRIELYNIAGQHVKTVFDGAATAGYYKVKWNGTNSADMPVASGTYFVRMRTEVSAEVLKILLLR
jgi:hypothetical protein